MLDFEKAKKALLVRRAQQGDADAFEQLVTPYEQKIYALCLRMMAHREDAQDAAQEAMLRIWQKLPQFRGDAAFSTWVYRVTAALCMDALRKRQRTQKESLEVLSETGFDAQDDAPTPEEATEQKAQRAMIAEAVDAVPEQMRSVFLLRDVHGLSVEDTAKALGVSAGTVKSRLSRAREKIAENLRAQGVTGGKRRAV